MDVRPLFWMMVGSGATLIGGAWGGKPLLLIPSESEQAVPATTAISVESAVKPDFRYAAENVLHRTPWVKPKADPFVEKRAVVPRAVTPAPVVENHEPPPLVFPYVYIGKVTTDGEDTLFFSKGDQIYPVTKGAVLEKLYQVENIGNDTIELSYLPDGRKLTVSLQAISAKPVPGASVPQPIMAQPSVDQKEITSGSRQVLVPAMPSMEENGQQSASAPQPPGIMPPELMPPELMPPRVMPPEMMQPGVIQPGMMQPGMIPPGMMQQGMTPQEAPQ